MPINRQMARLSVRFPKTELSRIKKLAASRGLTLQEAVHQALEAWASPGTHTKTASLESLQGCLAGVNVGKLMHDERRAELARYRRRSEVIAGDLALGRQTELAKEIMRDDRRILKALSR